MYWPFICRDGVLMGLQGNGVLLEGWMVFCLKALGMKFCTNFVAIRNLTVIFKLMGGGIGWVLIL